MTTEDSLKISANLWDRKNFIVEIKVKSDFVWFIENVVNYIVRLVKIVDEEVTLFLTIITTSM